MRNMRAAIFRTLFLVLAILLPLIAVPGAVHADDDYYYVYTHLTGYRCNETFFQVEGTFERNYPSGALFHFTEAVNGTEIRNSMWKAAKGDTFNGPST